MPITFYFLENAYVIRTVQRKNLTFSTFWLIKHVKSQSVNDDLFADKSLVL